MNFISRSCNVTSGTLERGPSGDVAAHDTRAYDMHTANVGIHAIALAFQAFLQEEDANEVVRGGCLRTAWIRNALPASVAVECCYRRASTRRSGERSGVVLLAHLAAVCLITMGARICRASQVLVTHAVARWAKGRVCGWRKQSARFR